MASEWAIYKLEDCMDAIIDYRGKSPKKTTSGVPLITAKIIKDGRILPTQEYIAEEDYDSWMRRGIPQPGDIVLTTEAPLGEIAQLGFEKVALAQRVITLRGKEGLLDNRFLKYLMLSHPIQARLRARASGTTVQGIKQRELRQIELSFPEITVQKRIAHILGTLDDKIELNRRMNRTLEKMAAAIFKSWFIDFDPVIDNALMAGNPIPDEFAERAEQRRVLLDQNQPSPPTPLPEVEGSNGSSPFGRSGDEGNAKHFRGGYGFSGLVETARELRRKQTPAEEIMWELLRGRRFLGLKFRRQHQIGDYIADFYCHECRIAIELDSGIHQQKKRKDRKRDAWLHSKGYTVLRFKNEQVLNVPESVLVRIAAEITPSPIGIGRGSSEGSMDEIHRLFPDSFEDSEIGLIPKGWRVSTLGELCSKPQYGYTASATDQQVGPRFLRITDINKAPWIDWSSVPYCEIDDTAIGKYLLQNGDIVIARMADPGHAALIEDTPEAVFASYLIRFRPLDLTYARMLQYWLRSQQYWDLVNARKTGSTRATLNAAMLSELPLVVPSEAVAVAFSRTVDPYRQKVVRNLRHSSTLAGLRDTLLPKLLSGELEVPDAVKVLEDAV